MLSLIHISPDTYEWPDDLDALEDGKRYVFVLYADAHPAHVDAEAASQDDPAGYIDEQLRRFVQALMEYMDPVSYTHLDVYKRQRISAARGGSDER